MWRIRIRWAKLTVNKKSLGRMGFVNMGVDWWVSGYMCFVSEYVSVYLNVDVCVYVCM